MLVVGQREAVADLGGKASQISQPSPPPALMQSCIRSPHGWVVLVWLILNSSKVCKNNWEVGDFWLRWENYICNNFPIIIYQKPFLNTHPLPFITHCHSKADFSTQNLWTITIICIMKSDNVSSSIDPETDVIQFMKWSNVIDYHSGDILFMLFQNKPDSLWKKRS